MTSLPVRILLGPQRKTPTVRAALDSLGLARSARVAAVTAGWEEREPEDLELGEHLGGPVVNLRIHQRADEAYQADPELHQALRQRHDRHRRMQDLYRMRLAHTLEAARELHRLEDDPDLLEPEREAAIEALRVLDAQHLERVRVLNAEFEATTRPGDRPAVAQARAAIARDLEGATALCIAGGHVGILLNRVRLLGLMDLAGHLPIVAWSAGAMALTERIVLFHDSPPQGAGDAEVFGPGLCICRGVVPLPHARTRLQLDDATRVRIFARRFRPSHCIALDEGSRIDQDATGDWRGAPARQLAPDGQVTELTTSASA